MCFSFKTKQRHTHTSNKHGRVRSWLHGPLPFMHASAWYKWFLCILYEVTLFLTHSDVYEHQSHSFAYCRYDLFHPLIVCDVYFYFQKTNCVVLIAVVMGFGCQSAAGFPDTCHVMYSFLQSKIVVWQLFCSNFILSRAQTWRFFMGFFLYFPFNHSICFVAWKILMILLCH